MIQVLSLGPLCLIFELKFEFKMIKSELSIDVSTLDKIFKRVTGEFRNFDGNNQGRAIAACQREITKMIKFAKTCQEY